MKDRIGMNDNVLSQAAGGFAGGSTVGTGGNGGFRCMYMNALIATMAITSPAMIRSVPVKPPLEFGPGLPACGVGEAPLPEVVLVPLYCGLAVALASPMELSVKLVMGVSFMIGDATGIAAGDCTVGRTGPGTGVIVLLVMV